MSDAAYLRKFIMLKPYTDQKDSNIKGYVKLEVRNGIGKTEINVDGFKSSTDEMGILRAYFLAQNSNDFTKANIGEINLKQSGKGHSKWEFNPKSVDDTGLKMEDFDIVLIEADKLNDSNSSQVKLTGVLKDSSKGIRDLINQFYSSEKIINEKKHKLDSELQQPKIKEKDISIVVNEDNQIENQESNKLEDVDDFVNQKEVIEETINMENEAIKEDGIENETILTNNDIIDNSELDIEVSEEIDEIPTVENIEQNSELEIQTVKDIEQNSELEIQTVKDIEQNSELEIQTVKDIEQNSDSEIQTAEDIEQSSEPDIQQEEQNIEDVINQMIKENKNDLYTNTENYPKEDLNSFIEEHEDMSPFINEQEDSKPNAVNYNAFDEQYRQNIDNYYGYSVNKTYNYMQNAINYKNQVYEYTKNIIKFFEKTDVLKTRLDGYTWWKIEYQSKNNYYRSFLPFHNYILNNNLPYSSIFNVTPTYKLIKKYKHYIFGTMKVNKDIKYYVYGIPGRFTKSEQPYGGMTGFCTWCPRKGLNRERLGYWLLHIDCLTGRNAKPLQPTPPKSN
ncbi:hypothetical protein [Abyssisolibacter fermentans]|uniref:hypothetical protein n=1 Tax=Abyssisolibacter fermentans TaxID=1766203 RepID=UPI00083296D9|nr:hypothetical protein [Abyssisolibacter fermentans]